MDLHYYGKTSAKVTNTCFDLNGHAIFEQPSSHQFGIKSKEIRMQSMTKTAVIQPKPFVNKPIRNLSGLFPLSRALALMPCAKDDQIHRSLVTYAVVTHVAYRVINVSVLAYFLVTTETSVTLYTLLALVTVLKCLCATVHIVVILRSRELLLKLTSDLEESDFFNNVYRKLTNFSIIYEIYLYSAGQFLQKRWLAAFRDVFSSLDVLCPIFIILQYCTFLKIATNRLRKTRLNLIVHFYKANEYLEDHLKNLQFIEGINGVYTHQMFFCVFYLGFDFFVASYDTLEKVLTGKNLEWTLCTVSYSTLCLFSVFVLCRACEVTKSKAEKFNFELYELMNRNRSLRGNDELMLYVRANPQVTFTGSNFFFIGYPLLTSIIAASTTYLVILASFGEHEQ